MNLNDLTALQRRYYDFIARFTADHGYPPTIAELCDEFRVTLNAVRGTLLAMRKKGALRWTDGKVRTLVLTQPQ